MWHFTLKCFTMFIGVARKIFLIPTVQKTIHGLKTVKVLDQPRHFGTPPLLSVTPGLPNLHVVTSRFFCFFLYMLKPSTALNRPKSGRNYTTLLLRSLAEGINAMLIMCVCVCVCMQVVM